MKLIIVRFWRCDDQKQFHLEWVEKFIPICLRDYISENSAVQCADEIEENSCSGIRATLLLCFGKFGQIL